MHEELRAAVTDFVRTTPWPQVAHLAQRVSEVNRPEMSYTLNQILRFFPTPALNAKVAHLLATWQRATPQIDGASLSLVLTTAGQVNVAQRNTEVIDLVWTGPNVDGPPLRRTDQALLEIIDSSHHSLLIVSFAVYNIPGIKAALMRAAARGVTIQICVESPEESRGKIAQNALASLGGDVARNSTIYVWPYARRPRSPSEQHGALHAKCAVCDQNLLFLSSANLTDHAFTLNMELGVMIRGGSAPADAWLHFQRLMERGELVKIT